jgi:hypothetical protein|tara:strand:- start:430 stop:693 length:264 start_codon:yes stop_codon:yes gene_type:complete
MSGFILNKEGKMKKVKFSKADALLYFGPRNVDLAKVLDVTPQAVGRFGRWVPELQAYKLRDLLQERLVEIALQEAILRKLKPSAEIQ